MNWHSVLWIPMLAAGILAAGMGTSGARGQGRTWRDFEKALAVADTADRFVLVAVYAPWCGWCHKMKEEVYPSEEIRPCLADDFVLTRLNRDDTDTSHRYRGRRFTARQLASALRADEVPTTVLLSPEGRYLLHLSGFVEPRLLRTVLAFVVSGAYRHTSFDEYRAQSTPQCGPSIRR